MLYIKITREAGKITSAAVATEEETRTADTESRWNWRSFHDAAEVAKALGPRYIATDSGANVSPRYDVIELPQVGDDVSYTFNGDYYPCGKVATISPTLQQITTTEGQKFYRRGLSGKWVYNQTWSLVKGHVSKLNPEF